MPDYKEVKSGENIEETESGAIRSTNDGKGRFDLIPAHPLIRLAKHFENGSKRYGDENWRIGMSMRRYLNSAMRHLVKYISGDREEDHLAAVAWNVFAAMDHEERIERGLLDPKYNDLRKESDFLPGEFDSKK